MRIENGVTKGSVNDADWHLLNGSGLRVTKRHVNFAQLFTKTPHVVVSLYQFDMAGGQNSRLEVNAENVDKDGFEVVFGTWADTRVYSAGVSWIAYGE